MRMPKVRIINKNHEAFFDVLNNLSDRELYILKMLYCSRRNQQEVAKILSITKERVSQIETEALELLNKYL